MSIRHLHIRLQLNERSLSIPRKKYKLHQHDICEDSNENFEIKSGCLMTLSIILFQSPIRAHPIHKWDE